MPIFYWIFTDIVLLVLSIQSYLASIPGNCVDNFNDIGNWQCTIESNNDEINCTELDLDTFTQKRIVQLKINAIDSNRHKMLFKAADRCNINKLKIEANRIPSNVIIGNLNSLEYLIVQSFQGNVPEAFMSSSDNLLLGLSKLEKFKIENFKVKLWKREIFQSCDNVKEIDLKSLEIESIDFQSFVNCKHLITLIIRLNRISKLIISSFSGLISLRQLILSSNGIVDLVTNGNSWDGVNQLTFMDLSNNKIVELTARLFLGLNSLEKLVLRDNQLKSLSLDTFYGLTKLTMIDLRSNPSLIFIDVNMLSPVKQSLTSLMLDIKSIQCVYDKPLLIGYRDSVKKPLQNVVTCNPDGSRNNINHKSIVPTTFAADWNGADSTVLSITTYNLTLIITVTVSITIIVLLVIFFIVYCITSRSKIKKYKDASLNNSCRYSRTDIGSRGTADYPGSEGTYAIFGPSSTIRPHQKSASCSVINQ